MAESRPQALSVFSGLGGLDLGARIAGLSVAVATDQDGGALSLLNSVSGSATLDADIERALEGPLVQLWADRGTPAFLVGGPPCTAFSHAGFWLEAKRDGSDPAAALLTRYLQCLATFRPRAFVLENVPGLTFKTHAEAMTALLRGARDLGYQVSWEILRASDFGVPQARRRLFVVGVLEGSPVDLKSWPEWPERSSGWAIADLEEDGPPEPDELPSVKYRNLLEAIPAGSNYLHFAKPDGSGPGVFRYRGRYWSFLLKLDPNKPSPTVSAQRISNNGPFHWTSRHLRIHEIARLQSFPDWYPLSPHLPTARRHLGNAVPPLLAAAVIWRVRQAQEGLPSSEWPLALQIAADPSSTFANIADAYPSTIADSIHVTADSSISGSVEVSA